MTRDTAAAAPSYPMTRGCPFDPPPEMRDLQRTAPVSKVKIWDGSTPWLITRYDDVRAALADPRTSVNTELPGYPHVSSGGAAQQRRVRTFLDMDDPEHAAQRRLLISTFTVRKCEALRTHIRQVVDLLVDDLLNGAKPTDLVKAVALPLPTLVICHLLGVPYADHEFFQRASNTVTSSKSPPEVAVTATEELLDYLGAMAEKKSEAPADDLLSRLAVEQLRTGRMTSEQIASMAYVLLIAGHETTANMIALGTAFLLENPTQLDSIRGGSDPRLLANAVEELLRYLNVVQSGRRRVASADMEIGGQLVREGDGMIVATDIANRDESAFDDPDTFDIHGRARHHVAFGYGVHQCLGQALARVELQVAYGTLFHRIPTLALAVPVEQLKFKHEMVVYGVEELPVTW
jgi:cytochrome P450